MSVKSYILLSILAIAVCSAGKAQSIVRLDGSRVTVSKLDAEILRLMQAGHVTGLAIAVFNNNKAVYEKTFGYKNAETKEGIKPSTNFYGASLSKAVFAVLVLKLVEQGVLDLDKPLQ